MAITVVPRTQTGFEAFSEGISPYLQMAFQTMLQQKIADRQRQKNLQQAQQMFPELFTPYQEIPTQQGTAQVAPMASLPKIPKKYKFNAEKLGNLQPSIDVSTGQITLKPEDAFQSYYRSLLPKAGESTKTDNIIYRDMTGQEISKEQAETDIAQGNTNYSIFRKEVTKSGVKEVPISKPEDLQRIQQNKTKSDFIISQAQDTLNTIAEIKKGINYFGTLGQFPSIPGTPRYVWQTNIQKLLSGKMIELMTQMKEASKTGATGFGQLSEKEGQILKEASTALKRGLPPEKALEYLNNMESALLKITQPQQLQEFERGQMPTFNSEQEAEASGIKGIVIINGRKARID